MNNVYGLAQEQLDFAASVREFARKEVGSRQRFNEMTNFGEEPHVKEIYDKLAAAGFIGVAIPEEYGGSGGGLMEMVILLEELWRGLVPVHGLGPSHTVAGIYRRYGSEDQKKAVLGAISDGHVVSISMSEPGAGSDAAAIACKAERTGAGFVLNGQKTWCSDAHSASRILLVARTGRGERPQDGLTMFDVPADAPGLDIRLIPTMGGKEVDDLYFTNVEIPADAVVGEEGRAWGQLMAGLNWERMACAAESMGMAQRSFDDLLAYVSDREQFGAKIGTFQALRHRIADLAIDLECARTLLYSTVHRLENEIGTENERIRATSIAKVKLTETHKKMALEGVQMMGGYGYALEYGMEHQLRRSVIPTIYAGTNEIQRDIIAGTYGLRPGRNG